MYTPKPGDFGIVKTNGWAARLIQLGTLSRWNHSVIYIANGVIAEATPRKGIVLNPVSEYSNIAWNQHQELTYPQRKKILEKANELVGKTYGFLDILIIGLRILGLKILRGKWLEKASLRQGIICSEYVAICYQNAGISLVDKPEYLVTPGDLAEMLIYQ